MTPRSKSEMPSRRRASQQMHRAAVNSLDLTSSFKFICSHWPFHRPFSHAFFVYAPPLLLFGSFNVCIYDISVCVCAWEREGRCLPAGCQVTSLIERPLENSCYHSLNLMFRLLLSFFSLIAFISRFPLHLKPSRQFTWQLHKYQLLFPSLEFCPPFGWDGADYFFILLIIYHHRCLRKLLVYPFPPAFARSLPSIRFLFLLHLCLSSRCLSHPFLRHFSAVICRSSLRSRYPSVAPSHLAFIYRKTWQEILIPLHNRSLTNTSTNPASWHVSRTVGDAPR